MDISGNQILENKPQCEYTKLAHLVLVHQEFFSTCILYAHFQFKGFSINTSLSKYSCTKVDLTSNSNIGHKICAAKEITILIVS